MSIVAAIRVEASEGKFLLVSLRRITSYMNFGLDELTVRIFRAACAAPTPLTSGSRVLDRAAPAYDALAPQSLQSRHRDPRSRQCVSDLGVVHLQPQRRAISDTAVREIHRIDAVQSGASASGNPPPWCIRHRNVPCDRCYACGHGAATFANTAPSVAPEP